MANRSYLRSRNQPGANRTGVSGQIAPEWRREDLGSGVYSDRMPLPEKALIEELRRMAASQKRNRKPLAREAVRTGVGDDCAVLRQSTGWDFLVTTDFSLE